MGVEEGNDDGGKSNGDGDGDKEGDGNGDKEGDGNQPQQHRHWQRKRGWRESNGGDNGNGEGDSTKDIAAHTTPGERGMTVAMGHGLCVSFWVSEEMTKKKEESKFVNVS